MREGGAVAQGGQEAAPAPDLASARAGLEAFVLRFKPRIGLPKCEIFSRAVLDLALLDPEMAEFAASLKARLDLGQTSADFGEDEKPELVTFLRGVKHALSLILQTQRKSLLDLFGREGVAVFDRIYQSSDLARADEAGRNFWHALNEYLEHRLREVLDAFVYQDWMRDLFESLMQRIEGHETFRKTEDVESVASMPSLSFSYEKECAKADVIRLFNPAYEEPPPAPEPEEGAPPPPPVLFHPVAEFVAEYDERYAVFLKKQFTLRSIKNFMSRVAEMDQPKRGESVAAMCERAENTLRDITYLSRLADDAPKKNRDLLKQIGDKRLFLMALTRQIVWFSRGVIQVVDHILLGECRKSVQKQFQAGGEFYDRLQEEDYGNDPLQAFYKELVFKRLHQALKASMIRFLKDMQCEGMIRGAQEGNLDIRYNKGRLIVTLRASVKKHSRMVRIFRALTRLNPALEREIIGCLCIAQPLAAQVLKHQKAKPDLAKALVSDLALARAMGGLIHADHSSRRLLDESDEFFRLVLREKKDRLLPRFMRVLGSGKPALKMKVMADFRLLSALWRLTRESRGTALAKRFLENPLDLDLLEGCLRDEAKLEGLIQAFLSKAGPCAS